MHPIPPCNAHFPGSYFATALVSQTPSFARWSRFKNMLRRPYEGTVGLAVAIAMVINGNEIVRSWGCHALFGDRRPHPPRLFLVTEVGAVCNSTLFLGISVNRG